MRAVNTPGLLWEKGSLVSHAILLPVNNINIIQQSPVIRWLMLRSNFINFQCEHRMLFGQISVKDKKFFPEVWQAAADIKCTIVTPFMCLKGNLPLNKVDTKLFLFPRPQLHYNIWQNLHCIKYTHYISLGIPWDSNPQP